MAKTGRLNGPGKHKNPEKNLLAWPGGATHQIAVAAKMWLMPNQDVVVSDNQNRLKSDEGFIELYAPAIVCQCIDAPKQRLALDREVRLSGHQT